MANKKQIPRECRCLAVGLVPGKAPVFARSIRPARGRAVRVLPMRDAGGHTSQDDEDAALKGGATQAGQGKDEKPG